METGYRPPVLIKTRAQQLCDYFNLLVRLAGRAERDRQGVLFDRIERTLAEMEAEETRPVPCGLGWPA